MWVSSPSWGFVKAGVCLPGSLLYSGSKAVAATKPHLTHTLDTPLSLIPYPRHHGGLFILKSLPNSSIALWLHCPLWAELPSSVTWMTNDHNPPESPLICAQFCWSNFAKQNSEHVVPLIKAFQRPHGLLSKKSVLYMAGNARFGEAPATSPASFEPCFLLLCAFHFPASLNFPQSSSLHW